MPSRMLTLPALLAPVILSLFVGGCSFITDLVAGPADERLAKEAIAHWATPGAPFMDGAYGRGEVDAVAETGPWTWEVTVAGDRWTFEVTSLEVFPVAGGDEFTAWLSGRARELGFRAILPAEILERVSAGRISALGDLEVSFGQSDAGARATAERVAYLTVDEAGKSAWSIQPESRSPMVLRDALDAVYSDMMVTDARVMDCRAGVGSATKERSRGLACIGDVLAMEFGQGPG